MSTAALPSYLGALDDPLRAMLLWFTALCGDPPAEICRLLGLQDVDREVVQRAYGPVLGRLRELRFVSARCKSSGYGQLLLARMTEMTLAASNEQQLAQLSRAAARLPLWVRDPELDALERELRHEECVVRMLELRARRAALTVLPPAEKPAAQASVAAAAPPVEQFIEAPAAQTPEENENHQAEMPVEVKSEAEGEAAPKPLKRHQKAARAAREAQVAREEAQRQSRRQIYRSA